MDEIGNELLERTRKVKDDAVDGGDKSVIGLLSESSPRRCFSCSPSLDADGAGLSYS